MKIVCGAHAHTHTYINLVFISFLLFFVFISNAVEMMSPRILKKKVCIEFLVVDENLLSTRLFINLMKIPIHKQIY